MNTSLDEWLKIDAAARKAADAVKELDHLLLATASFHGVSEEGSILLKISEDIDTVGLLRSLRLQEEWVGGDSNDPETFGLREPNILTKYGHIPHFIRGVEESSVERKASHRRRPVPPHSGHTGPARTSPP
jgi:hypothetical protein